MTALNTYRRWLARVEDDALRAELSALVWPIRHAYALGFAVTAVLAVLLCAFETRGLAVVGGALCGLLPILLIRLLLLPPGEACFLPEGPPDAVLRAALDGTLYAALNAANQAYGNASIQCSLDFGRPLATYKYVSCYFGGNGHRGTDYAAPGGTEIYAVSGGVVTAAAYHYSWGYYVQVYHGKDDNGNSYSTLYAHMNSAPIVSVGQSVSKGQRLGYVGSTGNSTGNHLHFETWTGSSSSSRLAAVSSTSL